MAGLTRTNGFADYLTGSVRTHGADIAFFKVTVRSTSNADNTAINLQTEDDGADELVELVIRETGAVASFVASGSAGAMALVFDSHNHSAASLAVAIENIDGIGTDTIVEVADQLTFK